MTNFDDPLSRLASIEDEPQAKKKKKPLLGSSFGDPLGQMPAVKFDKATKSSTMAGKWKRKSLLLPPPQVEYIDQIAKDLRMGKMATYRWLLDLGLMAYEAGEQPDVIPQTSKADFEPQHWSSNTETEERHNNE